MEGGLSLVKQYAQLIFLEGIGCVMTVFMSIVLSGRLRDACIDLGFKNEQQLA